MSQSDESNSSSLFVSLTSGHIIVYEKVSLSLIKHIAISNPNAIKLATQKLPFQTIDADLEGNFVAAKLFKTATGMTSLIAKNSEGLSYIMSLQDAKFTVVSGSADATIEESTGLENIVDFRLSGSNLLVTITSDKQIHIKSIDRNTAIPSIQLYTEAVIVSVDDFSVANKSDDLFHHVLFVCVRYESEGDNDVDSSARYQSYIVLLDSMFIYLSMIDLGELRLQTVDDLVRLSPDEDHMNEMADAEDSNGYISAANLPIILSLNRNEAFVVTFSTAFNQFLRGITFGYRLETSNPDMNRIVSALDLDSLMTTYIGAAVRYLSELSRDASPKSSLRSQTILFLYDFAARIISMVESSQYVYIITNVALSLPTSSTNDCFKLAEYALVRAATTAHLFA